jgi:hypothetical protein
MGRLSDGTLNPSVIYSSYLQQRHITVTHANTKPGDSAGVKAAAAPVMETRAVPLSAKTAQWLRQGGVSKVVVGHQPVGDAPHYMTAHGVQVRDRLLSTFACLYSVFDTHGGSEATIPASCQLPPCQGLTLHLPCATDVQYGHVLLEERAVVHASAAGTCLC